MLPFAQLQAPPPAEILAGVLCCTSAVAAPLALAIGAVVLRGACNFCRVAPPDFLPAMGVVLLSRLASGPVLLALGYVLLTTVAGGGLVGPDPFSPLTRTTSLLLGLAVVSVIHAVVYRSVLHQCSFRLGLLVWVVEAASLAVIGLIVGGFVAVLILMLARTP